MAARSTPTKQSPVRPAAPRRKKPQSARTESRRVGLSTELIVETACDLIAESHTDQLTMRRLSERLGVALGATYHHVPDRDSLLVLVAARINASVSLRSTKPADWAVTLKSLMLDYADTYARFPGMATFSSSHLAATAPDQTQPGLIDLLVGAGFSRESAYNVMAACFFYTNGATTGAFMHTDQPGYASSRLRERFGNGLDLLIVGAKAQLRADKRERRAG